MNQVCLIHDPRGRVGPQYGIKIYLKNPEKIFKILNSTQEKKLELVWKHNQVVWIQACLNHDLRGRVGPEWGIKYNIRKYRKSLLKSPF